MNSRVPAPPCTWITRQALLQVTSDPGPGLPLHQGLLKTGALQPWEPLEHRVPSSQQWQGPCEPQIPPAHPRKTTRVGEHPNNQPFSVASEQTATLTLTPPRGITQLHWAWDPPPRTAVLSCSTVGRRERGRGWGGANSSTPGRPSAGSYNCTTRQCRNPGTFFFGGGGHGHTW